MKTRMHATSLINSTTEANNNSNILPTEISVITKFDIFLLIFVFILSLLINGFLVGKIITDKRLQTSINLLLMIHNILNILLCFLTLLPAVIMLSGHIPRMHHSFCHVNAFGYLLVNYLSITNLASIAVDRWRTISNNKYTLVAKQIVVAQLIHFVAAVVFALPWTTWLNESNSVVEFSPGFLKCRVVHKTRQTAVIIIVVALRFVVFLVLPSVVISFCFVKIFNKVKKKCNSVGPVIHAPDGIPVGCYLKSAYTNALLISGFVFLRFPELVYSGLDSNSKTTNAILSKRFIAYITWIETALFPFICIMRNTTLLRRVTSMACCNLVISMFSSKQDRRRKQYEVEQSSNIERCISTPSQESNETAMTDMLTGGSSYHDHSPIWSRISASGAHAMPKMVTVF